MERHKWEMHKYGKYANMGTEKIWDVNNCGKYKNLGNF